MKLSTFLCIVIFVFLTNSFYAQTEIRTETKVDTISMQGILSKKQWSKSKQSFCAQGYEYYVLTTEKEEILIASTDEIGKLLDEHLNRSVIIKGYLEKKVIPQNDMLQHPEGSETTCILFHFLKFN
jgi:hypothetical protein